MARRIIAALILSLAAAMPARAEGPAPARPIYLAHAQPQNAATDPAAATASEFSRQLAKLSGGGLKAAIFPDGQLGGNRDMAQLVAKGVLQSALVTVGGLTTLYPPIAVTGMPFMLDSPEAAYALYDGPFGQALATDFERRTGLVVLGFADAGGLHVLTNSKRPVRSPADLDGMKIRTIPGYEALDAMIRALGAKPVKVSSREEFQSLEAGILDGQMNPPSVILSRRYYLAQGFATLTGHLYSPYVWIFNRAAFDTLSAAEQQAVRDAARQAITAGRALSNRLDHSERGVAGLGKRMEVHALTASERAAFKAATQPKVAETLTKSLGEDGTRLLADFTEAAARANAGVGR